MVKGSIDMYGDGFFIHMRNLEVGVLERIPQNSTLSQVVAQRDALLTANRRLRRELFVEISLRKALQVISPGWSEDFIRILKDTF